MILRPEFHDVHGIVFDLDGTLVDTFDDLAAAVNHVRAGRGEPALPVATVKQYVGRGARNLIRNTSAVRDEDDLEAARRDFLAYYRAHLFDVSRPYGDVAATLDRLTAGAVPMAILTNKPEREARELVAGLGLAQHFVGVYGGGSFQTLKPDPAALLATLDVLGVVPARALMVGDSDVDIEAARGAGVRVVRVRTGLFHTSVMDPDFEMDGISGLLV